MEGEREPGGEGASMASSRDVAFRESGPPPHPQNPQQHSRGPSMGGLEQGQSHHGHAYRQPPEAELNVLTRLEQQVSFNYGMIQGHRQDIIRLGDNVGRLSHEMNSVLQIMEEMRAEMRARQTPQITERARYDPGDVEVLTTQIASVTTKANEVDNLKVQVELMKRKIKRMEDQSGTSSSEPPPRTSSSREALEGQQSQQPRQPSGQLPSHPRPGMIISPDESRQPSYHGTVQPDTQSSGLYPPTHERRSISNDQHPHTAQNQHAFRHIEGRPESTGFLATNWRSAEAYAPPSAPQGVPPPPPGQTLRSNQLKSESQRSGWAAVNIGQGPKRPFDDHPPMQEDSRPGSPKRPRLAPLVPRSSHGEESYPPDQSPYARAAQSEPHPPYQTVRKISSGEPHAQQQAVQYLPAPPPPSTNSYRFITSTGQGNVDEVWREHERNMENMSSQNAPAEGGRGRGRGSRGGRGGSRRGGRGRGGRTGSGSVGADHPPLSQTFHLQEIPAHDPSQQHQPPEYREQMMAQPLHISPSAQQQNTHAYSPADLPRGVPLEILPPGAALPYNHPAAQSGHDQQEAPATPVNSGDAFAASQALLDNSGNKKTRTKPIRNAEGVLIRKDGRPDMRSVSSANNLRKVHAKKEAERAEVEGRTPTSGQSGNGGDGTSLSDEDGDEQEHDGQDEGSRSGTPLDRSAGISVQRHRELMSTMFPYGGAESAAAPKGMAEAWFPRPPGMGAAEVKKEDVERDAEARWRAVDIPQTKEPEPRDEAATTGERETLPPIRTVQDETPQQDERENSTHQSTVPMEERRADGDAETTGEAHENAEQAA